MSASAISLSRVRSGRGWSLALQLFVLQVVVVVVVVLAGAGLAYYDAWLKTEDAATRKVVAVARTLAVLPDVHTALRSPEPSTTLQPLTERVWREADVAFITIMDPNGIRYTHPDPWRIGHRFSGHIEQAQAGRVFTETYTGSFGPSVRSVVPVFNEQRRVQAMISVGVPVRVLTAQVREQLAGLAAVAVTALTVAGVATYLISARLRRLTHGLRPAELSRMYEYHDAILHSVREGLLLVSSSGQVTLCNDGAAVLLSLDPADAEGRAASDLGVPDSLASTLESGGQVRDEVHVTDDRVLLVNVSPIRSAGRALGNVVTLRDHTELQALTGELDSMRGFSESLRSQAHESANRLHTVVSLVELGRAEEAVEFATAELEIAQRLTDRVVGAVDEPVLAAVLLGKSAEAHERGADIVLTEDTAVSEAASERVDSRDLVTILGNLIDNGVDAALEADHPRVEVTVRSDSDELMIRVADNGLGLDPYAAHGVFQRGWSTKGGERGLGLALVGQAVRRYGGRIEVGDEGGAVFTVHLPSTVDGESS